MCQCESCEPLPPGWLKEFWWRKDLSVRICMSECSPKRSIFLPFVISECQKELLLSWLSESPVRMVSEWWWKELLLSEFPVWWVICLPIPPRIHFDMISKRYFIVCLFIICYWWVAVGTHPQTDCSPPCSCLTLVGCHQGVHEHSHSLSLLLLGCHSPLVLVSLDPVIYTQI